MSEEKLTLFNYFNDMNNQEIILTFKGTISQEILADVGISLRSKLNSHSVSKKTFAIFVELAQNIYHHSAQKEYSAIKGRTAGVGVILIQNYTDYLILSSGNLIESYKIEGIQERCEYINTLTPDELREYYMKQRKRPTGGVGANIGLIDMARRSGNPLEYQVVKIDEYYSFFALSIKVSKHES
ncbi:MAG: SiaB family protein kinase [Microscillaceae bacterium]